MALEPITTSGPTITVSTLEELHAAYDQLSYTEGGGTILLEPGDYGNFGRYPYGVEYEEQPVIIKSADPEDPAHFTGLSLRQVSNIRIENVLVDSTADGIGDGSLDLKIQQSTNIQIVDSVFQHDADNALKDAGEVVDSFSYIRDSSNILFEGNVIDGYFHALQVTEVSNIEIIGNELTNMQGDGFRGGGLQDMLIEGNYFHDFYGVDQNVTHSDLIQIWGSNADTLTENVTITGNTLITSGAASQSIFIRNEEFGDAGDPTAGYYTNITITDNLIYNAHKWGIHLDNVDGALIDNNTLLWNPDAVMVLNGEPVSYVPEIFARNSLNITATDNIAGAIILPDGSTDENNQIVTYDDPGTISYVGNHFVNPLAGADVTLEDLYVLPSSPWFGTAGSSIGNTPGDFSDGVTAVITAGYAEDEQYEVTYDAGSSFDSNGLILDNPGYTYLWTFADGTTAEGLSVTKIYDFGGFKGVELEIQLDGEPVAQMVRNFHVETKDIFAFDFEDGAVDISDAAPDVLDNGTATGSNDGQGYLIGDGGSLEISRQSEDIFQLDSFGLTLDLTPTGDEPDGVFLNLYQTMTGAISEEGYVTFQLTTDEGTYELISREPIFDDGETHRLGIAFDGNEGRLELFADGESVSETEAWGTTPEAQYWGLIFGNVSWKDSMDAIIDNVEMSSDPSVAGELPVIDPPAEDLPAEDPPAEDPPAEDPPAEDPPAEDPPAEDPPAEEPPAEDPPAEEDPPADEGPGDRGEPPEAVESSGGSKFFLLKILEAIFAIFGGGGSKGDPAPLTEEASVTSYDTTLADLVPVTETLDEDAPGAEDDDEFTDLAA